MNQFVADAVDRALEVSIVGSFTKMGTSTRRLVHRWPAIEADLSDRVVLITGGSSGIGRAAAERLADHGAAVVITSRDAGRAAHVATEIQSGRPGRLQGWALDTSDLDSIAELAKRTQQELGRLDVLVHNAGALLASYSETSYGVEYTLASHLVGPYHLTNLLLPLLSGGRVLWMSSGGMYTQRLDVDRLAMPRNDYRGAVAYARAKRAQVELVAHLGPRLAPEVRMYALHPGWVNTPGVSEGLPGFGKLMRPILRSADDGADTLVWLAAGQGDQAEPGAFFFDRATRSTVYLPGTGTDQQERERLIEWLDTIAQPTD